MKIPSSLLARVQKHILEIGKASTCTSKNPPASLHCEVGSHAKRNNIKQSKFDFYALSKLSCSIPRREPVDLHDFLLWYVNFGQYNLVSPYTLFHHRQDSAVCFLPTNEYHQQLVLEK